MSAKDEAFGAEVARTVYAELMTLSRKPFTRQLAKILGCAPTEEAIRTFANKNPDRWAQSVAIFAPLAGIVKDTPINVNIFNVKDMSDSALIARARELKVPVPPEMLGIVVEAEALPRRGDEDMLPGDEAGAPEFVSHGETLNTVEPGGAAGAPEGPSAPSSLPEGGADAPEGKP